MSTGAEMRLITDTLEAAATLLDTAKGYDEGEALRGVAKALLRESGCRSGLPSWYPDSPVEGATMPSGAPITWVSPGIPARLGCRRGAAVTGDQLQLFDTGTHRPSVRWGIERWPLADLLEAVAIAPDGPSWAAEAALRFGVCRRRIQRWRHHGLTTVAADEAAIRAGLHPAIVWDTWSL